MKGLSKSTIISLAAAVLFAVSAAYAQGTDSAGNYTNWTNGSTGGSGFSQWFFANSTNDAGQCGQFFGTSTNNGAISHPGIDSTNNAAWGMYANNNQTANAFRIFQLKRPLQVGQTFQLDYENGFIDGAVGFGLQDQGGGNRMELYFQGGTNNYTLNIGTSSNSFQYLTPVAFTVKGLRCAFTLASTNTMNVTLTGLNTNGVTYTTNGVPVIPGGTGITQIRLWNFNSGNGSAGDVFYNNLSLSLAPNQLGGLDNADNYAGVWTNGSNKGTGFGAWTFASDTNDTTLANVFLANSTTNGAAGINSQFSNQAFGMYASSGSNSVTAAVTRPITGGLAVGQTITVDFENGNIDGGGTIGVALQDASSNNRIQYFFVGGQGDYFLENTNGPAVITNTVGYTQSGLQVQFTVASADTVNVQVTGLNGNTASYSTNGVAMSGTPGAAITQVRLFDFAGGTNVANWAFFNNLGLSTSAVTQVISPQVTKIVSSGGDINVTVPSVSGWTYQLQYRTNMTDVGWINAGSSSNGSGSPLTFPDVGGASQSHRFYRVQASHP